MKLVTSVAIFFAIAVASLVFILRHAQGTKADATDPNQPLRPVVVELFTSEGCSSCPPADALLAKLDQQQRLGNAEIIALEEHVDYWDGLGWRDPFSSAQWTERQQNYASSFGNEGIYTPQMVVDGRTEFVGSSQSRARSAIAEAVQQPKAEVALSNVNTVEGQVRVKIEVKMLPSPAARDAQVWLAVTEVGLHSDVKRGENAGEDLHHAAVVRSLRKVGDAKASQETAYSSEQEMRLDSGWKQENLRVVAFVQDAKSRHILGAAAVRLKQ
jgi:hypothetical protein